MVVFDRPRRVLFSTTLRAFVESRPPRAIALATPRDTVANLLRIARRARASQVLVVQDDAAENQSTNPSRRTRAVSMRDVARGWMRTSLSDGAFYERFTTRELCDAIGATTPEIVWYDESTRAYDAHHAVGRLHGVVSRTENRGRARRRRRDQGRRDEV